MENQAVKGQEIMLDMINLIEKCIGKWQIDDTDDKLKNLISDHKLKFKELKNTSESSSHNDDEGTEDPLAKVKSCISELYKDGTTQELFIKLFAHYYMHPLKSNLEQSESVHFPFSSVLSAIDNNQTLIFDSNNSEL